MADDTAPADRVFALPPAPDAVELRHLRAFVAVAEELNFGRAAARLYISQPALSRQIRTLERLVGCDLLRRNPHRVELTLAGEALLDRTRPLLHDVDDAISVTRSVGGEMAGRMARVWQAVTDLMTADAGLQALRDTVEVQLAEFTPPPEVQLRPVNAGGVPSLLLSPEPAAPAKVLFVHGGGRVMGSAHGYRGLAGALAAATGAAVLIPEYRLGPEHPFPAPLEDVTRAYLWMLGTGAEPGELALAGDSAGNTLVLSLMLSLRGNELPMPGCAVLMCPDIDLGRTALDQPSDEQPLMPVMPIEQYRRFVGYFLGGHPIEDPLVNPFFADLAGLPPLLVQAGTGDTFLADARKIVDRAREHGVDARLDLYPVPTHDFHLFWSFLPEAADALQQAGRFIRQSGAQARRPSSTG